MKRLMVMTAVALVAASVYAMSLAEARGKTDAVIANPAEMTSVMKQLSKDDQKSFVAAVNEAICKMPGSTEEKCAKALNVNHAAVAGAVKGNTTAIIAEIFATAPVESLTLINESFARDVLNRAADPKKVFTDEQYSRIATNVVNNVNKRLGDSDEAGVRGAFAALMMVRASNGTPATLSDDLAGMLGSSAQTAKNEWFPEALATPANYGPMFAETEVETEELPDIRVSLLIAGPQRHDLLLGSLINGSDDPLWAMKDGFGDWSQTVQTSDEGLFTVPRGNKEPVQWQPPAEEDEPYNPRPYNGQRTH